MKRRTKLRAVAFGMALMLSASSITIPKANVQAAESISELERQNKESERKRKEAKERLAALNAEKNDVLADIEALDIQIDEYQTKIDGLTDMKNSTQASISVTEFNIQHNQFQQSLQHNNMKTRIQYSYENGDVAYIDALMSVKDFTDITNQSEYLEQIAAYDKAQLEALLAIKIEQMNYQTELSGKYEELTDLQIQAQSEQAALEVIQEGKEEKIKEYNASIADEKQMISRLEAEEKERDKKIAALEKAAAEAAAAAAAAGNSVPTFSGGKLKWPCPGHTRISSNFGPRKSPTAGASSYHKGIDIPCPSGTSIIAAAAGTVIYVGYQGSGGKTVILSHGNGLTTIYHHLSGYAVSNGATVKAGQIIAYSGNTGVSTGPHLHFSVRVNGTYVNPRGYL